MQIDYLKTDQYYKNIDNDICDCMYCRYFIDHIIEDRKDLDEFLKSMKIDIKKPYELSIPRIDEDGNLLYDFVQYLGIGKCEEAYNKQLSGVNITKATSYPFIDLSDDYFVLELYPLIIKGPIPKELIEDLED